ncbi:MAG: winged helix-turn-helix domain-containing protein [Pseudomonadota bacterium]
MNGNDHKIVSAADLAHREAFRLGSTHVIPATRRIEHGGKGVTVQPRIMQVLLALVDADGSVVSRDDLTQQCWAGRFVADDSLNAAIAELRRAFRLVGSEDVRVETIPKTGYRLAGPRIGTVPSTPESGHTRRRMTRTLIASTIVAAAAVSGVALVTRTRPQTADTSDLMARGTLALRQGLPDSGTQAVNALRQVVSIDPDNARAWGLLALAWRAASEYADPARAGAAARNSELAARRALTIDPRQSDALTALALLVPSFGQWAEAERRLRAVLAIDSANQFARSAYGTLLMSTGQAARCLQQLDWLVQRDPLSPNHQFRRVYTLWSNDRLPEMDRVADAALQSWPRHVAVWFARFWTLAFTDRVSAALRMLANGATRPPMPAVGQNLLELSLRALDDRGGPTRQAAIAANTAAATTSPGQAVSAIMLLSGLNAPDQSLEVARGFLLRRGQLLVEQRHSAGQPSITDQHHRMAMMLWIPASNALRMHPGFKDLCDGIGLVDYWRRTGSRPDFREGSLETI